MNNLSGEMLFYLLFLVTGLSTGIVFWVIRKYPIPAVLAFIFALIAPLLTLFIIAQREAGIDIREYVMGEISAGNALARIVLVIHVYLIVWLLFLIVRGIIYLNSSPQFKESMRKIKVQISEQLDKITRSN